MTREAHLFRLEIGNHLGEGTHFNIVAESLEEAWMILFELAIPKYIYHNMTGWRVDYLGSGKLITN